MTHFSRRLGGFNLSLVLAIVMAMVGAALLAGCAREKKDERIVLGFSQIGAESEAVFPMETAKQHIQSRKY